MSEGMILYGFVTMSDSFQITMSFDPFLVLKIMSSAALIIWENKTETTKIKL